MPRMKQTPGNVLASFLKKHNLNYNRLAKAIGLSSAMVRLIARDENPVSASVAFRLAKFFKTKPEYWLALQMNFDISETAKDKKLIKALKEIPTADKAVFERKPRTRKVSAKPVKPAKKAKAVKASKKGGAVKVKTAAKRGRPAKNAAPKRKVGRPPLRKTAAVKKAAVKTAKAPAKKRGRPAGKPAAKPTVRQAKPAAKPVKKARPAAKVKQQPVVRETPPQNPQPVFPENLINEPQI